MSGDFIYSSKSRPCPVCGRTKDGDCRWNRSGLHLCKTYLDSSAPVLPGWSYRGPTKDHTWGMWARDDDDRRGDYHDYDTAHDRVVPAPKEQPTGPWTGELITKHSEPTDGKMLAQALGILAYQHVFHRLGLRVFVNPTLDNFVAHATAPWCWPEIDADGEQCAWGTRSPNGTKRAYRLTREQERPGRGLVVPDGWEEDAARDGVIYFVEGMSDVAAGLAMGMAILGRPNNMTGALQLLGVMREARHMGRLPKGIKIVVIGENDKKADGKWPGKEGALVVAGELALRLGRDRVRVILPPEGTKDLRGWLLAQTARSKIGDSCAQDTQILRQQFEQQALEVNWPGSPSPTISSPTIAIANQEVEQSDIDPKKAEWDAFGRGFRKMMDYYDAHPELLAGYKNNRPSDGPISPEEREKATHWTERMCSREDCKHLDPRFICPTPVPTLMRKKDNTLDMILFFPCCGANCKQCGARTKEEWWQTAKKAAERDHAPDRSCVIMEIRSDWNNNWAFIRRLDQQFLGAKGIRHGLAYTTVYAIVDDADQIKPPQGVEVRVVPLEAFLREMEEGIRNSPRGRAAIHVGELWKKQSPKRVVNTEFKKICGLSADCKDYFDTFCKLTNLTIRKMRVKPGDQNRVIERYAIDTRGIHERPGYQRWREFILRTGHEFDYDAFIDFIDGRKGEPLYDWNQSTRPKRYGPRVATVGGSSRGSRPDYG